jgi:hypothetical protein
MNQDNIENSIHTDWEHLYVNTNVGAEVTPSDPMLIENKKKSVFFWFFIFGFILLVCAAGFFAYQKIGFSTTVLDTAESGDEKPFSINISNTNKVNLENVKVRLTYQKGFTRVGVADLVSKDFNIGQLLTGAYISTSTDFMLIGREGDIRKVKMIMYYKVAGSNAEFTKTFEKDIKILSPAVSLRIEGEKNIIEDNETVFIFKVKNLSLKKFIDSTLVVETSSGFSVKKEDGAEIIKTKFEVKNLKIGEEKSFSVIGYFKNNIGEVKNLRAYMAVNNLDGSFGSSYAEDVFESNVVAAPISYAYTIKSANAESKNFIYQKENFIVLNISNISENNIDDINIFLENKDATKSKIVLTKNEVSGLSRIMPDVTEKIEINIPDEIQAENKYKLEIYGKRRGDLKTSLLKKSEIIILGQ